MTTQRKTAPALETVEVLLDEVDEYYDRFSKIRRELSRACDEEAAHSWT